MNNGKNEAWVFDNTTNRYNFMSRYTSTLYNPANFTEYDWYTDCSTNEKIHYLLNDIILNRGRQHFFTIRNRNLQKVLSELDKDKKFDFENSIVNTSYDFTKNDNDLISFQQILSQNNSPKLKFKDEKEKAIFGEKLTANEKLFDKNNVLIDFKIVLDYFSFNLKEFTSLLKLYYSDSRILHTPENLAVIYYWGVEISND